MLLRYKALDEQGWHKHKVSGASPVTTVAYKVRPCTTYRFQLKAKVGRRSGVETLQLGDRMAGPPIIQGGDQLTVKLAEHENVAHGRHVESFQAFIIVIGNGTNGRFASAAVHTYCCFS